MVDDLIEQLRARIEAGTVDVELMREALSEIERMHKHNIDLTFDLRKYAPAWEDGDD